MFLSYVLYELLLALGVFCYAPFMLFSWLRHGKYKRSFFYRLGLKYPNFASLKGYETIWIHAVSVGEVIAASSLFEKLKEEYPESKIILSCVTETGYDAAGRLTPSLDEVFFLPFDFYISMNHLLEKIKPKALILIEGELWPNLLRLVRKRGIKTILVNAKISARSYKRLKAFQFFTQKMLSHIDSVCAQKIEDEKSFIQLGYPKSKIHTTGNLKFDIPYKLLSEKERDSLIEQFQLKNKTVITIASSHEGEEALIFSHLKSLLTSSHAIKIFLIPRHPQRFETVKFWLKNEKIPFVSFSEIHQPNVSDVSVILIDAMGMVSSCYEVSDIAIVGGSFVPIGGHNILESIRLGVPTLYGPYMHAQKELEALACNYQVGFKTQPQELLEAIQKLLCLHRDTYREKTMNFMQVLKGSSFKTFNIIRRQLNDYSN